jgi:phosphohistidine phosphatase
MKTLTLIRHATACEKINGQSDQDRDLSAFGRAQASDVARQLKAQQVIPDMILCSPAQRTQQTAVILCDILELDPKTIILEPVLYSGDEETILQRFSQLNPANNPLIIGHNPNLSWLTQHFCQELAQAVLAPANVVKLAFALTDWCQLANTPGKLLFLLTPYAESD